MSPVDALLWVAAAALAGAAVWLTLPRPVALDWELYFKLAMASALRGEVEAAGGSVEDWVSRCRARLWYHPGGRELGLKLRDPAGYSPPVPALPGERALLEALARSAPERRAGWLLSEGFSDERLYGDPSELGEAYDLERVLGPGAGWEALAGGTAAFIEALRRRNAHNIWVVVGGGGLAAGLAEALAELLGAAHSAHISGGDPEVLARALDGLLEAGADRLVLIVLGGAAGALLRCLHAEPRLRDRTRMVLGVGAALGPERSWLAEHFDHEQMDTEISRALPYAHLGFVLPGAAVFGEPGLPLVDTAFHAPPVPPSGRAAIEILALGPLIGPSADFPPSLLARSLAVTATARLVLNG